VVSGLLCVCSLDQPNLLPIVTLMDLVYQAGKLNRTYKYIGSSGCNMFYVFLCVAYFNE